MDFSKVDWMHTLGTAVVVGVGGAALLATLPVSGPLTALTAMGVTVSAGSLGVVAAGVSAVSQAKAAAAAAK